MATDHHHLEDLADSIEPRKASNILLWAIAAFFVIALLWAMFTQLDRTVHGPGRVVPTAQLQIVSNLEGGIVREILVRAGASVKAGAPLIRLDQTATGAELGAGQIAYEALRAKVNRLEAEINGTRPIFPVTTNAGLNEQINIERSLYSARQADLAGLTAAGNARLLQAERGVFEAQSNLEAATAARDSAKQQTEMMRPLVTNGIEPRLTLVQLERQAAVSTSQAAAASAALSRSRAAVAESRALLNQQRQDWRSKAGDELAAAQAEMASRSQGLPALQDRVDRTIVRAPLSGKVNRVFPSTLGGTVRAGEPLVEIVPADSGLTIEVAVRPDDIAFIRMGQRALVKLSAYDYGIYGGLDGKVVGISPDAITNDKDSPPHYIVRVRTAGQLRGPTGQALAVGPGMMADVNLIGDKRSILAYLLTPITRLQENAFRE